MTFNEDVYLYGRCHIFALALHEELGYDMELFWDLEAWFDEKGMRTGKALVHAYCIHPSGGCIDARGKITMKEIEDDYEYNVPYKNMVDKQELLNLMENGFLDKPFQNEIQNLKNYIRENKEKF